MWTMSRQQQATLLLLRALLPLVLPLKCLGNRGKCLLRTVRVALLVEKRLRG